MESVAGLRNLDLSSAVKVQVAKRALDAQKDQGRAAVELLRSAAEMAQTQRAPGSIDLYA